MSDKISNDEHNYKAINNNYCSFLQVLCYRYQRPLLIIGYLLFWIGGIETCNVGYLVITLRLFINIFFVLCWALLLVKLYFFVVSKMCKQLWYKKSHNILIKMWLKQKIHNPYVVWLTFLPFIQIFCNDIFGGVRYGQLIQMMTDCYSKMVVEGTWVVQSAKEEKELKSALALFSTLIEKLKADKTQCHLM